MLLSLLLPVSLTFSVTFSDALAAYNMESQTGGIVQDVTNHGYDSINGMGGTTALTGPHGNALAFDGSDQIRIAHDPALRLSAPYTVEAMFLVNSHTYDWVRVVGKGYSDTRQFGLWYHYSGIFLFQSGNGSSWENAFYYATVETNRWYHMTGVYTGSQINLYLDGVLVSQTAFSGLPTAETEPLTIGGADFHAKHIGLIDNVALYNFSMLESDIVRHSQGLDMAVPEPASWMMISLLFMGIFLKKARASLLFFVFFIFAFLPLQASTLALWGFNEGSGNTVYDMSGNNNDITFPSATNLFSASQPSVLGAGSSLLATNSSNPVAAGSGTSLNVTGNMMTMEAWVKISAPNTTSQKFATMMFKSSATSDQPYWFGLENRVGGSFVTDRWQFEYLFTDQDGTRVHNQSTNLYLSGSLLNQWVHLAVVYDGRSTTSAATVTLYINGSPTVFTSHSGVTQQRAGADYTLKGNLLSSEANLVVGGGTWGQDYWIDEMRISDTVLTPGTGTGIDELAFNAGLISIPEAQTWIGFLLGSIVFFLFRAGKNL